MTLYFSSRLGLLYRHKCCASIPRPGHFLELWVPCRVGIGYSVNRKSKCKNLEFRVSQLLCPLVKSAKVQTHVHDPHQQHVPKFAGFVVQSGKTVISGVPPS